MSLSQQLVMVILAVFCLGMSSTGVAEELPLVFPLEKTNASVSGKGLRMPLRFTQQADGAVVMEAEDATEIRFESVAGAGMIVDEKASAGICLSGIENIRFDFHIKKAGRYQIWLRAKFPWRGSWNHTEEIDGKQTFKGSGKADDQLILDFKTWNPNDPQLNTFMWVKAWTYDLGEGAHAYALSYKGGCFLDKVAILPIDAPAPSGNGPAVATRSAAETITLASAPLGVAPSGIQAFGGAFLVRGGKAQLEISADGNEWKAWEHGASLAGVWDKEQIRARVTFSVSREMSPVWVNPSLRYGDEAGKAGDKTRAMAPADKTMASMPLFPKTTRGVECLEKNTFAVNGKASEALANGAFYFEAELPDAQQMQRSARVSYPVMESASGKKAARSHPVRYQITVPSDGTYRTWIRVPRSTLKMKKISISGGWDSAAMKARKVSASTFYRAGSAQSVSMQFTLSEKQNAEGDWVWFATKGEALAKGLRALQWQGWSRHVVIDRIAVLPEGMEPDDASKNSARTPLQSAEVVFTSVTPARGHAMKAVTPAGEWAISFDEGKAFTALGKDGTLPPQANKTSFVLRNTIKRGTPLREPALQLETPLTVSTLENAGMALAFNLQDGRLLGVWDKRQKRWVVPPQSTAPQFLLAYEVTGEGATRVVTLDGLSPDAITRSEDTLTVSYSAFAGMMVFRLAYQLPAGEALCKLSVTMENKSPYTLRELSVLNFPQLRMARDPMNELLAWPKYFGGLYTWPSAGSSASAAAYPGTASTSFCAIEGETTTFYLAERQRDGILFTFKPSIVQPFEMIGIHTNKSVCIAAGETWRGDYAFGILSGTWHAAADAHRAWLRTWLPAPKQPEWLYETDGFNMEHTVAFTSHFPHTQGMINDWFDIHYNQIWGWTADGSYIGCYPVPDPRRGTKEATRKAFDAFRVSGNHVGFYLNAQEYRHDLDKQAGFNNPENIPPDLRKQVPGQAFFDKVVQRGIHGGKQLLPVYEPTIGGGFEMCVAADAWSDHLAHWVADVWVKDYGVNAHYFDQSGCITQHCYAPNHGHGHQHAQSAKGFLDIVRKTCEAAKASSPDFALGGEGIVDIMTPYVSWGLWVGSSAYRGEFFKYLVPETMLSRQYANGHSQFYSNRKENLRDTSLFNWFESIKPGDEPILKVRRHVRPFVNRARFMASRDMDLDFWGDACWYERNDGGWHTVAVMLHNLQPEVPGRCTIRNVSLAGSPRAYAVLEGGTVAPVTVTLQKKTLSFAVPSLPLAAVVVVAEAPQAQPLQVIAEQVYAAGPDRIRMTLVNVSAKTQEVKVSLADVPSEVRTTPASATCSLKPGQVEVAEWTVSGLASLPHWVKGTVLVAHKAGTQKQPVLLTKTIVNESFELDENGDGQPDGWGSMSFAPFLNQNQKRDIQDVMGTLVTTPVKAGKKALFLGGPMPMWEPKFSAGPEGRTLMVPSKKTYPRRVKTPVVLKQGTTYLLRMAVRRESETPTRVRVAVDGMPPKTIAVNATDTWQEWETSLTIQADHPGGMRYLSIINAGPGGVYVDGVTLEEQTE